MKPILLITGGLGYIGSHVVVALEQAGYQTVIIDNLVNSSKKVVLGLEEILGYLPTFYECDIRNHEKLESIFQKYSFSGVVHLAGLKAVGESCEQPFLYHDNNIVGSLNLFKIMDKKNVKNIVFSSSATVYDSSNSTPFLETSLLGTTNPYGTTKFVLEKIIEDYAKHASWNVASLRYFNPIGAHESGVLGENPLGIPNNLLPYIFKVAIGELDSVKVFGDDYKTKDGTGERDYIDVNDLAKAHVAAYKKIEENKLNRFHTINIGTGTAKTVLEMIQVVEQVTEKKIPYEVVARRSGDIGSAYSNSELAEKFLDWKSTTSLEKSIETGWKFIKKGRK